jgi:quercetin dioxygenase-like cupin family protein
MRLIGILSTSSPLGSVFGEEIMSETFLIPPGGGTLVWMGQNQTIIKATAAQTCRKFGLVEMTVAPGAGPAPHHHLREEEAFFILEGEITFYLPTGAYHAGAGCFLRVSRGQIHSFHNETDKPARLLMFIIPGGLEGYFAEVGLPAPPSASLPMTKFIERVLTTAPFFGMEYCFSGDFAKIALPGHYLEPFRGDRLRILGDEAIILADSAQTNGQYNLIVHRALPGAGIPPHRHNNEDEAFYILEGEITLLLPDGTETTAGAGAFFFSPKGTLHAWYNRADCPLTMLVLTTPGGFDNFFCEIDGVSSPEAVLNIASRYNIAFT